MGEAHHAVVVEVDADIRELIAIILRQAGYTVHSRSDAASGLAAVRVHSPDFVTVDCTLPGGDGYILTQQIRCFSRTCITMLSARVTKQDQAKGYAAGIDYYLTKPFSTSTLREAAKAVIRSRGDDGR
jgi:DNA-binding response OmpR family regulator